jgi:hypothetical protein
MHCAPAAIWMWVREGLALVLQALIEAQAARQVGAGRYVRSASRTTHRNGSRARLLSTKAGDVELHIPKLREDSFFAALLDTRRRIDRAPLAVAMEAYVHALSSAAASLGLDLDGHATGRAKTLLFAPTALAASGDGPGEGADGSTGGGEPPAGETVPTKHADRVPRACGHHVVRDVRPYPDVQVQRPGPGGVRQRVHSPDRPPTARRPGHRRAR